MAQCKPKLRSFHLFAGAGGGILADLLLGHRVVGACEIEEYPREVLLQRQRDGILPEFPIWDDITALDGTDWRGKVDLVCGGFPCQDISTQGDNHEQGKGIDGERSGLWSEMARIICEVRPKYVFVENSPALTIRGMGRVLGDLATMGYDAKWGVLGACDSSLDHQRNRIWILAESRWELVRYADQCRECECCGEPYCDKCNEHYAECSCIGPTQDDVEYSECGSFARVIADTSCNGLEGRDICNQKRYREATLRSVERLCEIGLWHDLPTPNAFGDANGLASRVDRLKAIGNGQVPAVAALAFTILKQRLTNQPKEAL